MPQKPVEYRFEIDAFTPGTIPLSRLSEYLGYLAQMMGEEASVHLSRVEEGSTIPIILVDWEAEPKVRERLTAVKLNEGPSPPRRAFKEINRCLVQDNAAGVLIDAHATKVIKFPGRHAANQIEFGPINQTAVFQGIPIMIGGKSDPVSIHLEDGDDRHIIAAPRRIAKEIAQHLFTAIVRIEGKGRWVRNRIGEWEMSSFYAQSFEVIPPGDVRTNIETLRAIPAAWKGADDPLADITAIRTGERAQ